MSQKVRQILIFCMMGLLLPAVAWADTAQAANDLPFDPNLQPAGLDYARLYQLRRLEPNLTGEGVTFAVICRSITYLDGEPQNDYRPNTQHNCFAEQNFSFHEQNQMPAGISPHSTAVCSLLFGSDAAAFDHRIGNFTYQGIIPDAKADVYEFWHFLINNVYPQSPPDVDVLTAGVGTSFESWWTRGIESLAEHHGLAVVAGIGNGRDSFDTPLYPGACSNVIGVGVVDSVNAGQLNTRLKEFSLAYPQHSSFGPTSNGRAKPDIVAAGNCLVADAVTADGYRPSGNWCSYSTPVVAGAIGLLTQKAKQDASLNAVLSPEGGNCLIKAILLNSATKLAFWHKGRIEKDDDRLVPLDFIQGAGLLNAAAAYNQLIAGQSEPGVCPTVGWDLNDIKNDGQAKKIYQINIPNPQEKLITVTLAWNRHYKDTYPFEPLVEEDSNLRLEIRAVDTNDPNQDYLLDYSDSPCDNLEHIYTPADANFTDYRIIVSLTDASERNRPDTTERYALAWSAGEKLNTGSIFWYDLNADGIVDESDFGAVLENWLALLKEPGTYFLGDINSNGAFDPNDLQILLDHKGRKAEWHID